MVGENLGSSEEQKGKSKSTVGGNTGGIIL